MFFDVLKNGARGFGIALDNNQLEKFDKYKELLKEWNSKINLTSILDDCDIATKHFVDSISIEQYIKDNEGSLIDIGTGAGFPAIPIKILKDGLDVVLLDSLEKRIKFLDDVIDRLRLQKIKTLHGRAEDIGMDYDYREKFDYVTARAVASLPVLLEYCLPFVKKGGLFIAMKGSNVDEINISKNALKVLGGEIIDVKEFLLPNSDYKRNIILVSKIKNTPTKYPRKAGKPSKMPL